MRGHWVWMVRAATVQVCSTPARAPRWCTKPDRSEGRCWTNLKGTCRRSGRLDACSRCKAGEASPQKLRPRQGRNCLPADFNVRGLTYKDGPHIVKAYCI